MKKTLLMIALLIGVINLGRSQSCVLSLPSAFTPNNDGKNDSFGPIGNHYKILNFIIKNKWGQTVFESQLNDKRWDGTFNGVVQDLGIYNWYITYDCDGTMMAQKGYVTLIR